MDRPILDCITVLHSDDEQSTSPESQPPSPNVANASSSHSESQPPSPNIASANPFHSPETPVPEIINTDSLDDEIDYIASTPTQTTLEQNTPFSPGPVMSHPVCAESVAATERSRRLPTSPPRGIKMSVEENDSKLPTTLKTRYTLVIHPQPGVDIKNDLEKHVRAVKSPSNNFVWGDSDFGAIEIIEDGDIEEVRRSSLPLLCKRLLTTSNGI